MRPVTGGGQYYRDGCPGCHPSPCDCAERKEAEALELEQLELSAPLECEMCGGPALFLGRLGLMDWFQCRACGHQQGV